MPSPDLPIHEIEREIVATLKSGNRLVLVAPTGSGKTTQVPQMLLDAGLAGDQRIIVLQPRRVAARTVAARVASERGVRLGAEVGYQIRFEDRTSLGTRICFVTEGILLRWLQDDPSLAGIAAVLFDEFHERNLLSDVSLALTKRLQTTRRPDLKIIVMSATLEAKPVAEYLNNCPVLISQGQMFPVEVNYLPSHDDRPLPEQAAEAVCDVIRNGETGDLLVFMPGMAEINATISALRVARTGESLALLPLHGELPPEEQDRAFAANSLRKVIVATNVAETSVTIDGVRHVIDSGLARIARYDAERGLGTLLVEPISRASADQRKGRAGRTAPGTCQRLWTESGHLNRPERNTPEIQRADLAEVVLLLHSMNVRRAVEFDWLDKPDPAAVERAEALLRMLGALQPADAVTPSAETGHSDLTPIGRQMLHLPLHPRYSRMLLEAAARGCVPVAALCAALVSGRDLLVRLRHEEKHIAEARELFETSQDSDFFTLIRAFEFAREHRFDYERCRRYGIHVQTTHQVQQTYEQICQIAERQRLFAGAGGQTELPAPDESLLRCIMAGFIDQLCVRRDEGTLECFLTEGRTGTLMRESVVQKPRLFVAANIREVSSREGQLTLLGLASAVKREWIESMFPQHITTSIEHIYDRTHKRVAAIRQVRFRDLVLAQEHQRELDPIAAGQCLAEAHRKNMFELPLLNHELKQFMARVNLVSKAMPELDIPPFGAEQVAACLARAFRGLSLAKEAQAAPLREVLLAHLPPGQLTWINEMAPTAIQWPAGRSLKLLYSANAIDVVEPPEFQVKLHECFALRSHPTVCDGRVAIRLWLASPDGKRLESTTDWPAFKSTIYPKLKPALQKKYPGVGWL